jgi:hypothetical protein
MGKVDPKGGARRTGGATGCPRKKKEASLMKEDMTTTTVEVPICFAMFVLVVALTLVVLMLVVPVFIPEPTYSGYY